MRARLEEIGFEVPTPDFTCKFKPLPADIDAARAWGREMGELVIAKGKID
jgi:hypothetical protein